MINIAFVMNGGKPPRGGEYLTLYLITHLRRDIFRPILFYAEEGIIVKEIKKSGMEAVQIPINRKITGIYPREIKLYNPLFIITFAWNIITGWHVFKLRRLLKEYNIHLIYCADNLSKFIGGIAGKMAGVKVVAHCHDDFKEDTLGKTMRMFYLMLLDRILTVSDKVKMFFAVNKKGFQKAITVYNGIDTDIFNPQNVPDDIRNELGLKKENIVIGSIGVIEKDKGHRYLVETIARLKDVGITNVVCVICGTGPEEADLRELVNARGIGTEVLFLGYRNDIPKILKVLDILIMTSLTIESFSMAAVEAMAMELPVIATNVGGIPEVVDNSKTGIIVPPGNVDALCEAIKYLIQNPGIRFQMGKKGREKVLRQFTIEENVRKTEEVFLEIIKDK
ncbi:MAG: glycosyltransferase family 4 protein [Candidatus Brocadiaceae bacterium]|nr:glycosyltransferase family 4 protein [Candidatus Brocadiaceae bacterium]